MSRSRFTGQSVAMAVGKQSLRKAAKLEFSVQGDPSKAIAPGLAFVLARAHEESAGDVKVAEVQHRACFEVSNERFLMNAVTALPEIAIQKGIVSDSAA